MKFTLNQTDQQYQGQEQGVVTTDQRGKSQTAYFFMPVGTEALLRQSITRVGSGTSAQISLEILSSLFETGLGIRRASRRTSTNLMLLGKTNLNDVGDTKYFPLAGKLGR